MAKKGTLFEREGAVHWERDNEKKDNIFSTLQYQKHKLKKMAGTSKKGVVEGKRLELTGFFVPLSCPTPPKLPPNYVFLYLQCYVVPFTKAIIIKYNIISLL